MLLTKGIVWKWVIKESALIPSQKKVEILCLIASQAHIYIDIQPKDNKT